MHAKLRTLTDFLFFFPPLSFSKEMHIPYLKKNKKKIYCILRYILGKDSHALQGTKGNTIFTLRSFFFKMILASSTFEVRENIQGNCGCTCGFGGRAKQLVITQTHIDVHVHIMQACNM